MHTFEKETLKENGQSKEEKFYCKRPVQIKVCFIILI